MSNCQYSAVVKRFFDYFLNLLISLIVHICSGFVDAQNLKIIKKKINLLMF